MQRHSVLPSCRRAVRVPAACRALGVLLLFSFPMLTFARDRLEPLRHGSPESVGFSSERLRRLDALMRRAVDEKEYAGAVTLLARHGKVIHFNAIGKRDLASGAPLERDSIFRLFSMTKPVTAVAMMILYEEGKWSPQDPLSKFIPEFAHLKVYRGIDASGKMQVEDPDHPPTMRELMTMTAGFSYGAEQTPVDRLYRDANDRMIFHSGSLQAMIDRLARAPLVYQPGSRWLYSLSVDIQGYLIEKLSGMTLPRFMQQRVFGPLGMKDTAFYVPQEKQDRFATLYKMSDEGELIASTPEVAAWGYDFDHEPALPMGGGGLVTTVPDFYRFAQMLLNGGELDGVRVLAPRTLQLMMSNQLPASLLGEFRGGGYEFTKPRPGIGFGFDGAVVTDPGLAGMPVGAGSYFWNGAAGTWFWVDPAFDIVMIGMVQRIGWGVQNSVPGLPPNLEQLSMGVIYQALLQPTR
jgi:CubicO group peptidase (beta-lactamase class C family)